MSKADKKDLKKDADFYQVQGLLDLLYDGRYGLEWEDGPNYIVSKNGKKAKKIGENKWNAVVISANFAKKWAVNVVSAHGYVYVGIAPATIEQKEEEDSSHNGGGWFVCLSRGTLYPDGAEYSPMGFISGKVIVELTDKREVIYTIDGTQCGVAYKNIPNIPLVACVFIHKENDSVEFVDL